MAEEEAEVAPTKALVYASASFIGGHLCKALKAAGLEVDEATAQSDVLAADVIICSVYSKDPAEIENANQAIELLSRSELDKPKTFILISSVMTWARTPAEMDGEDEDASRLAISDEDFKKRRAHPAYKANLTCERTVYKAKKENLNTYVVGAGLVYGLGESDSVFHDLFKSAWHCQPVTLYGSGSNIVPTIHTSDLCTAITALAQEPTEQRYILAVGAGADTLGEIVQSIAQHLGNSNVTTVPSEEAMLLTDAAAEYMSVDLKLESAAMSGLVAEWACEEGMVESLAKPVAEYRQARNLQPICVFVHGPPGAGCGTVAAALAKEYKLHHLTQQAILAEAAAAGDKLSRQLKRSQTKGKIPMPLVLQAVRRKLNAPSCCNQGYVLDSFPETHQQATHLFKKLPSVDDEEGAEPDDEEIPEWVDEDENTEGGGEEDAEEPAYEEEDDELAEGVEPPKEGKVFTPAHLVVVDATDEHLQATVKDLSEAEIVATYESEDGFVDQLAKWRAVQEKKPCVTDYFESQDIDPIIHQAGDLSIAAASTVIGEAHNYGPTPEDIAEQKRIEAAAETQKQAEEAAAAAAAEAAEAIEREQKQKEMEAIHAELEKEEDEILKLRSLPLRKYLVDMVIPTLTQGLINTCKERPSDPIDHLAEYLLRQCEAAEN